jgi:hypothetical protein
LKTPLLMVATTTRWLGAARIPRSLANAGFDISVLAPRNSLIEKSRFVSRIGHLHDSATPLLWARAFSGMVEATSPRLVVPCDDTAFWLLQMLATSPPDELRHASQIRSLILDSLGDPAWYSTSVDKTLLPAAAEALGVRVPSFTVTADSDAAGKFAAAHGYPVVLKRRWSSAGDAVRICPGPAELATQFSLLQRPRPTDLDRSGHELLVQAHIPGRITSYHMAAWKGTVLTGYAAEKVERSSSTGPSTVQRYHARADIEDIAIKVTRGFGISGFMSSECVVDERTGAVCLLELNRRMVSSQHRGSTFDVDHSAALHSALNGTVQATRTGLAPGEEHLGVHFPQEWLRDPASERLRKYPVDVPWDEPELFRAMLAMRHEE